MLRDGYVTKEQLEEVLRAQHDSPQQRISGWRLGELLIERGLVTQGQVAQLVAEQYELPYLELDESRIDPRVSQLLPPEMCERYSALPIESLADGSLLLAVSDPATVLFSDELRRTLGRPLRFAVVAAEAMEAVLGRTGSEPPTLTAVEPGAWPSSAVSFAFADDQAQAESHSDEPALTLGDDPSSHDATTNGSAVAAAPSSSPLGTLLVRDGLVTEDELEAALAEQRLSSGKRLGEILVERGSVTRADIARVVAEQYELPFIDLEAFDLDPRVGGLLPLDIAERFAALPLDFLPDGSLRVAVADPTKVLDPEEILAALGARLSFAVADPDAVESAIARQQSAAETASMAWPSLASIGPPVSDADHPETDASDLIVGLEEPLPDTEPSVEPSEAVAEIAPELRAAEEPVSESLPESVEHTETWSSTGLVIAETPEGSVEADLVESSATVGGVDEHASERDALIDGAVVPAAEAKVDARDTASAPPRKRGLFGRLRRRSDEPEKHTEIEATSSAEADPIADLLVAGEASAYPELSAGGALDDERERRSDQASVLRLWMSPETSTHEDKALGETAELETDALDIGAVVADEPVTEHVAEALDENRLDVDAVVFDDPATGGVAEATEDDAPDELSASVVETVADDPVAEAFDEALDLSDEPSLDLDEGDAAVVENASAYAWAEWLEVAVEDDARETTEIDAQDVAALVPAGPETPADETGHPSADVTETADAFSESPVDIFRHEAWSTTSEEADPEANAEPEREEEHELDVLAVETTEDAAEDVVDAPWFETEPTNEDEATFESEEPRASDSDESETPLESPYLAWLREPHPGFEADSPADLEPVLEAEPAFDAPLESGTEAEPVEPEPVEAPETLAWVGEVAPEETADEETPWMFVQPESESFESEPSLELVSDEREVVEHDDGEEISALDVVVAMSAPDAPAGFEAHEIVEVDPPVATFLEAVAEPTADFSIQPDETPAPDAALAAIVERATTIGATTLHFSAQEHGIVVRARVDGVLRKLDTVTGSDRFALARELSSAANSGTLAGGHVTALPTPHGETFAVRFRPSGSLATLEGLSLDLADREALERALRQPFGLVLVTGPSGSGHAGTLAAALHELATAERAVMTIEDPILHVVPGADQVAVDHSAGRGFADGLRQLLAADPDVVFVGELADEETSRLAVEAAASNLVASSVVAQSAVGAVDRLEALGVDPDLIASTLSLVIAQRLVRRLCDHCREGYYASAADIVALRRPEDEVGRRLLGRSTGCPECGETGYTGTIGMYEVLVPNDEVRALVAAGAPAAELERAARLAGKRTLADDGVRLCLEGLTTVAEVQRVLGRSLA